MVLLGSLTAANTTYTLSDSILNYKRIVTVSMYQGFVLNSVEYPANSIENKTIICCFNDGTLRKGQYQVTSDTTVRTAGGGGSTYIKLPDGTAFAWGQIKFGPDATTGTKIKTVNFPLTFIAKPAAVISWYDTEHVFEYFNVVSVYNPFLTANTFAAVADQIKNNSAYNWYACYIAIGKWK